jgi:carbonic anhydrase
MRLFEAICQANERWLGGDKGAAIPRAEYANDLPIAALTCVDVRLNPLLPHVLGLAEEDFIWLRNAGNVITGPLSSTMRSLTLACAVKGGKEIAIIGHTDCLVCKTTMLALTDALSRLGVDRHRLPENLNEYFGLFASERQNVIKAVDHVRHSPLIGAKIPVHGLLLDLQSGRLEWIVNGYQSSVTSGSEIKLEATIGGKDVFEAKVPLPEFQLGEMKFPDLKIGEVALHVETTPMPTSTPTSTTTPSAQPAQESPKWQAELQHLLQTAVKCKIIGSDLKQYGPITGAKLLEWLAEGRIDAQTPVQVEGHSAWTPLAALAGLLRAGKIPLPPPLASAKFKWLGKEPKKR